jgi:hypothetical protein
MSDKKESRAGDVVDRAIGQRRISKMSGAEFLKAVAKVTGDRKVRKAAKRTGK